MNDEITLALGQSNMVQAHTAGVPYPGGWVLDPGIQIWYYPAQTWQTYIPGVNSDWSGPFWGPEAEYARQHRLAHPCKTVWLWKQAVGGCGMFPQLDLNRSDWSPHSVQTKQFYNLTKQVAAARACLSSPVIDTMIMVDGETDATEGRGTEFRFHYHEFDRATRIALNAPDMKVVLARILPFWDPANDVRNAIMDIGSKPGYAWIDIDDVERHAPNDPGHFGPNGTKEVGRRLWVARSNI